MLPTTSTWTEPPVAQGLCSTSGAAIETHDATYKGDTGIAQIRMLEGAGVLQMAQFLDLSFEFGNRLFEIEKARHGPKNRGYCRKFNWRRKQTWLSAHGVSGLL